MKILLEGGADVHDVDVSLFGLEFTIGELLSLFIPSMSLITRIRIGQRHNGTACRS
jgi:hypothetical protein